MTNSELLKIAQEKIANFEQAVREEHEMSDSVADQEIYQNYLDKFKELEDFILSLKLDLI